MPPNKTLTNFVVNKVRVFDNYTKSNLFHFILHRFKWLIQIVHKLWNDHACMFGKHYFLHFEIHLQNILDK